MAKKTADGYISVNRAPTSHVIVSLSNMRQIGLHADDITGISVLDLKSLPKTEGAESDIIRTWRGNIQSNWSSITYTTMNRKYVSHGLTLLEKYDTIFKNQNWKGLNPKISGDDGTYVVMIAAADASGASSVKTLKFNVNYYRSGDEYTPTGNGVVNTVIPKVAVKSSNKTTSSKLTKNGGSSSGSSSSSGSGSSGGTSETGESLERGSSGEEVKKLQRRLNELGYDLSVDGDFGENTEAAVEDFQEKNDLSVDGVVGPKTWAKLNSDSAIGKGPYSKNPNGETNSGFKHGSSGGTSDSGKTSNSQDSEGSSKENAIVDDKKFRISIDANEYSDRDAYAPLGNYKEGYISVVCKRGSLTDYEIDESHGMTIAKEPIKTKSNKGNDMLKIYPKINSSTDGEKTSSEYGDILDDYLTIIGYYNDNGTWYTSKCRMHYVIASESWWRNAGWKSLSTNVSN